jgi:hypothetical protein
MENFLAVAVFVAAIACGFALWLSYNFAGYTFSEFLDGVSTPFFIPAKNSA